MHTFFTFSKLTLDYGKMGAKEYFRNVPPLDFLVYAFDWQNTKEGFDFWCDINKKWLTLI